MELFAFDQSKLYNKINILNGWWIMENKRIDKYILPAISIILIIYFVARWSSSDYNAPNYDIPTQVQDMNNKEYNQFMDWKDKQDKKRLENQKINKQN